MGVYCDLVSCTLLYSYSTWFLFLFQLLDQPSVYIAKFLEGLVKWSFTIRILYHCTVTQLAGTKDNLKLTADELQSSWWHFFSLFLRWNGNYFLREWNSRKKRNKKWLSCTDISRQIILMARGKKEREIYRLTYEDTLGKWDAWERKKLLAYTWVHRLLCGGDDEKKNGYLINSRRKGISSK